MLGMLGTEPRDLDEKHKFYQCDRLVLHPRKVWSYVGFKSNKSIPVSMLSKKSTTEAGIYYHLIRQLSYELEIREIGE